ncbi:hypothetical protein [Bacillus sp. FJAT-22090]|uniref:hypothetical protein n=1 Tax=Bacillus sp. FJAT-22090 TaxID=1581038 RepID=UPI0011A22231|nr:hypothetical protein [Bacillus sp. FJAT-22090]
MINIEKKLKDLYESYYAELLSCPYNDKERLHYICGKQQSLEELANATGIELEHKNILTFTTEVANIEDDLTKLEIETDKA